MDIEALKEYLNNQDLDGLLDLRDEPDFEESWLEVNAVLAPSSSPLSQSVFLQISEHTNGHEIASYISDDLDLIYRAHKEGYESRFVTHLESSYKSGIFPVIVKN